MNKEVSEEKSEESNDLIIDDFLRPLIDALLVLVTEVDV